MNMYFLKKLSLVLCLGFVLASCTGQAPYIYNSSEFDRESPNFAKEIKDRSKVEICYNKRSTTPLIVRQMAEKECGRFGKKAVFQKHAPLACSIVAPAQAVFDCIAAQ